MDEVAALAGALNRRGCRAPDDARGAQWTKLLFNAATNPLAALTGLTARRGLRAARPAAAGDARWWRRGGRSRTRSGSRSTATPTS